MLGRSLTLALLGVSLVSCRKEPAPPAAPPVTPKEVELAGAYHAVSCGAVTAVWNGSAEALKDLPQPAAKSFGVESLAFRFADGSTKGFAQTGQLFFNDWRFDVFSPDCASVVLLGDHYGPYLVVKTSALQAFLAGKSKPLEVRAPAGNEAFVHSDLHWKGPEAFEFTASCCGGAQVFSGSTNSTDVKKVFDAAQAPRGLRRTASGYEVVP